MLMVLMLSAIVTTINAAKATGLPRIVKQPDGTTLVVRTLGDEHRNWCQTMDGVLLVRSSDAYYIATVDDNGLLESTGQLAHNVDLRSETEKTLVKAQKQDAFKVFNSKRFDMVLKAGASGYPRTGRCPHTGSVRVPVIMMQYPDCAFTFGKDVFEDYFNSMEVHPFSAESQISGYGSVRRFFHDASNGQLDMQFDLYGVYTAKHDHDYYGRANSGVRLVELYSEALEAADADIDFTKYDSDGNGDVDLVYILYAGTSANAEPYGSDKDVWPQCSYGMGFSNDGMNIDIIGVSNEMLSYAAKSPTGEDLRAGIGVLCHEISHGMGLPDLYWTSSAPIDSHGLEDWNNCGPEDFDLMDGGENLNVALWPVTYTAWEKEAMGWIETEILDEPCTVTMYPLNDERGKAYKIVNPVGSKNEYYVIENMQLKDWNRFLYHTETTKKPGLLVYHINGYTQEANTMTPNNIYRRPRITLLPADGFIAGLYGVSDADNPKYIWYDGKKQILTQEMFEQEAKGDLYPGLKNVNEIREYKNYIGDDLGFTCPITNITVNSDSSITFEFKGGASAINEKSASYDDSGAIYSLDGRLLGTDESVLSKGVYVKNGKKLMKL